MRLAVCPVRHHVTLLRTAALAVCLITGAAAAQPAADRPPVGMAVVVVQGGYPKIGRLERTVEAGARLAGGFARIGWSVLVISDSGAKEAVENVLKAGNATRVKSADGKARGVQVAEANDAPAVNTLVTRWMRAVSTAKPPVAFLVLSGHGEERPPEPPGGRLGGAVLLTVADHWGAGGVAVADLRREAASYPNGLPLVIVYDACRSVPVPDVRGPNGEPAGLPAPAPAADASDADAWRTIWGSRKTGGRFAVPLPGGADAVAPTVVYTTRQGQKADATVGFIDFLARGLIDQEDLKTFLTWLDAGRTPDLTLGNWMLHAEARFRAAVNTRQSVEVWEAAVNWQTRVARWDGGRLGPPRPGDKVVDVTRQFRASSGELSAVFEPDTGWTLEYPTDFAAVLASRKWYTAGPLTLPDGIDPTGRQFVLDVVASRRQAPGVAPPTATALGFHAQPAFGVDDLGNYRELTRDNYRLFTAPWDQRFRVTMPLLDAGRAADGRQVRLDLLAFAGHKDMFNNPAVTPWEPGASLRVVGMRIEPRPSDRPPAPSAAGPVPVRLVSGDWSPFIRAAGAADGEFLSLGQAKPKDPYRYRLATPKAAKGWFRCGGELNPPVYVPARNALYVEGMNLDATAASTLLIDLLHLDEATGTVRAFANRAQVVFKAGERKAQYVALDAGEGYADFLGLSVTGPGVALKGITLEPAPRKLLP